MTVANTASAQLACYCTSQISSIANRNDWVVCCLLGLMLWCNMCCGAGPEVVQGKMGPVGYHELCNRHVKIWSRACHWAETPQRFFVAVGLLLCPSLCKTDALPKQKLQSAWCQIGQLCHSLQLIFAGCLLAVCQHAIITRSLPQVRCAC